MALAIFMAVFMHMSAITPKPEEQMAAKCDHHQANGSFKCSGHGIADREAKQQRCACQGEQCDCVAKSPGSTMAEQRGAALWAGDQAGYGGQMVGFQGMGHADDKTQKKEA